MLSETVYGSEPIYKALMNQVRATPVGMRRQRLIGLGGAEYNARSASGTAMTETCDVNARRNANNERVKDGHRQRTLNVADGENSHLVTNLSQDSPLAVRQEMHRQRRYEDANEDSARRKGQTAKRTV